MSTNILWYCDTWGGGVETPCLALMLVKKHIFLECPGYAKEVGGNSWLLQATFSTADPPVRLPLWALRSPSQQAAVLPSSWVPWRRAFHCPWSPKVSSVHTTWDLGPKACFTPQLISSDKRSHQEIKSELLRGSAELYTQAPSQADLYLPWFSFAILIFRNKNGSITLKKEIQARKAFSHCRSHTRTQTKFRLFKRNLQNRLSEHHCMMLSALELPVVKREPWFLETTKARGCWKEPWGIFVCGLCQETVSCGTW